MRVLWLVNVKLPEVSYICSEKPQPYGGWLAGASTSLVSCNNLELAVAFPESKNKKIKKYEGKKIHYYGYPGYNSIKSSLLFYKRLLKEILTDFKPDMVHIFGTEFTHSLLMSSICKENGVAFVLSIQGLVSQIANYYYADLPYKVIYGCTLRNIIKKDPIFMQRKDMTKRGRIEIESINIANNIIGRTTWDKACIAQINPEARYFHCNEILRESFYENKWVFENCQKHSIFIIQGQSPIKGLHYVLHALFTVIKHYPQTKLYVCGYNNIYSNSFIGKFKMSNYEKYILDLINKFNLRSSVIFLGTLNEKEMVDMYLESNVFICPSSIENSSNSLGEAMLLGVPCIASYVGGIPDLIIHNKEGFLYQHNDYLILAFYIMQIFQNPQLAKNLSEKARKRALLTHNKEINTNTLISIYDKII